jgi:hypothetical protein
MTYYDDETLLEKPAELIIEDFLDILLEFHSNRDHVEIKKILKIKDTSNIIIDDSNRKDRSVRSNPYIKKTIRVLQEIVSEKVFTIWIENVISVWNNKLNNARLDELDLLFKRCSFKNCYESDKIVHLKIDEDLWGAFLIRCRRSNLTNADGFKLALVYYVLDME